MAAMYDVIIVGGGVIGSAAAYYLSKEGRRVLLLEQFPLPHTRGSSHGQSRITHKASEEVYYTEMMKEAHPMWRTIEQEANVKLMKPCDHLIFGEEGFDLLVKTADVLEHTGCRHEKFTPRELQDRFPMLNFEKSHAGVLDHEAGVLHADKCVSTLQALFLKFGGELHDREKVTEIRPGPVIQLITNRGQHHCKSLILTPGPWAPKLVKSLGLDLPIRPVGVTVGYWKQKWGKQNYSIGNFPSFVATHGGSDEKGNPLHMYGLPADEYPELVRIGFHGGQLVDPDSRDAHPEDTHDIEAMKVFVRSHFPGLEDFPSITERCIISVTPDEDCILDHHPSWNNIIIGAGFSGHGFTLAPIVGKILGQLSTGITPDHDIGGLKLNRFNKKAKL